MLWLAAVALSCPFPGIALAAEDLTQLPLERLLALPVYSASKLAQNSSSAPASVTVITAEDFRTYGYRTLGDALRRVRGMFVYTDRNYQFLGTRGLGRIGDYNSRFLVLIDGHRTSTTVYDQVFIGEDALIDVDLIERVEVVQGPGSSAHGGNAFLGVINIITRSGGDIDGAETALEAGSGHRRKARLTAGRTFDNGASLILSGSTLGGRGRSLYLADADAPATNNGIARGVDFEQGHSMFVKFRFEGLTLSAASSERAKGIGYGQWGTVFNDSANRTRDENSYVNAVYQRAMSERSQLTTRVSWGRYEYTAMQVYVPPPVSLNRSFGLGEWWSGELNWTTQIAPGHRLLAGMEYQWNRRQQQRETDEATGAVLFEDARRSRRTGWFVQDEYALTAKAVLHTGLRIDRSGELAAVSSPRLALVMNPASGSTVKLVAGSAFRAPSVYELYYAYPGANAANPNLRPERIRQLEAILEQDLRPGLRATASVYRYQIRNLISAVTEAGTGLTSFQNLDQVRGQGMEFGLVRAWAGGSEVRSSLALQSTRDNTGAALNNSPRGLLKLNYQTPHLLDRLRAGLEFQGMSSRGTAAGRTGGQALANANIVWDDPTLGTELSLGIYNLGDRRYADPVGFDPGTPRRDTIPLEGRSLRLKWVQRF